LPEVEGDRSELGQVAMNLIMNASDALLGRPGTIEVATSVEPSFSGKSGAWLGATPGDGPYVTLSVRDDGCGIEPEVLSRMFEPFFTTKPSGRGFGLATTLGVVRGHGGFLTVDSKVGLGTEVKIYLPVAAKRTATIVSANTPTRRKSREVDAQALPGDVPSALV
jgi:signal transduction histidine kinase